MELQQLRYIVALSQTLNFQKAAQKVHVTQPTLSQQIKKLEHELGLPLFERRTKGVRLTEAGQKFLPHAITILDQLAKALNDIQESKGEISGKIRFAAIPTIGPYLLPAVIKELKKKAPKVSLEIYEETTSALLTGLKEGKFDLGILSLPISEPTIVSHFFGKEEFLLAVSKGHPLAKRRQVIGKDIKNERLLILQEGHCFGEQALEFCRRSRDNEQVVFQGSSLTSVMKLTEAGQGVTLVPKMAAEPHKNPGLCFLPFRPPRPKREIGLVWRISAPLTKASRLFMSVVETVSKKWLE